MVTQSLKIAAAAAAAVVVIPILMLMVVWKTALMDKLFLWQLTTVTDLWTLMSARK